MTRKEWWQLAGSVGVLLLMTGLSVAFFLVGVHLGVYNNPHNMLINGQ